MELSYRVLAGGADCSLVVDGQSDDLYELRFDPDGQEVKGRFTCKPQSTLGFVGMMFFGLLFHGGIYKYTVQRYSVGLHT